MSQTYYKENLLCMLLASTGNLKRFKFGEILGGNGHILFLEDTCSTRISWGRSMVLNDRVRNDNKNAAEIIILKQYAITATLERTVLRILMPFWTAFSQRIVTIK